MSEQDPKRRVLKGRGAVAEPDNRFERVHARPDWEQLSAEDVAELDRVVPTEFLPDDSKSLITEARSPDVPFRWSINAYRGCEHGCSYCYARPYHETLGLNAGLEFETKILVKYDAAKLLRKELGHPRWQGEVICLSGVTDPYQPAERRFRLTLSCLEVMAEAQQAVGITTKNSLVLRDLDLLASLAERNLAQVNMSIPTLDAPLSRVMEPRTATPAARLRAIRELTDAGVPVRVLIAPIIPGLTDHEVAGVMEAAAAAGAIEAHYVLLRLPLSVAPVFMTWLEQHLPDSKAKVESLVRSTRKGRLYDATLGERMVGTGAYAESIRASFQAFAKRYGLAGPMPPLDTSRFRPPKGSDGQLRLF